MLVKTYRFRLYIFYLVPVLAFVGLCFKLYREQVIKHEFWNDEAKKQHFAKVALLPLRGKILDSKGYELAGSSILDAAYLELSTLPREDAPKGQIGALLPEMAEVLPQLAGDLAETLNLSKQKVLDQLQGKYNRSPLLTRDIDEAKKVAIREVLLKYRGSKIHENLINFQPENKRKYSRPDLAPHVVGYTQMDDVEHTGFNKGAAGVERFYNNELKGKKASYTTMRSATGNPMEPADPAALEEIYGQSVKLTINDNIQLAAQKILEQGIAKTGADNGVAICYHVKTGEILALASSPQFSLDDLSHTTTSMLSNRAVSDPIEPGSVMKIVTFTSLFDEGLIQPTDYIDCSGGTWIVPKIGRVIKDSHAMGGAPVSEVFQYSSNIGTIKAAQRFDRKSFYEHITRFGFGQKTGVDLPGESAGRLRDHTKWDAYSMSSLPMGYEMQVTAVQVVAAVGAIANEGVRLRPHVVKEVLDHEGNTIKVIEPEKMGVVASPSACRKTLDLMELVVEKGTGKAAQIEGYRVGGKTGTTKKLVGKSYDNHYIAGFCGIAPIEKPEVCVYVYIDNPREGSYYGGTVAGPVFREITRVALKELRIPEQRANISDEAFQVAMDKVRKKIEPESSNEILNQILTHDDDEVASGSMPSFIGLSLIDAVKKASMFGLEVQPVGTGIVVDQDPAAFQTIEGSPVVTLSLVSSRDYVDRQTNELKRYEEERAESELVDSTLSSSISSRIDLGTGSIVLKTDNGSVPLTLEESPRTNGHVAHQHIDEANVNSQPETEYPDLDPYAQSQIDLSANKKSWAAMEKDLAKMKVERAKAPRAPSEAETLATGGPAETVDRPIPQIDGSEEIDPTRPDQHPIDISAPTIEKPKKTQPKNNEISLYNF